MTIFPISFGTPEYDESVALRYEVLRKPLGLEFTPEQLSQEWSDIHLAGFNPAGIMVAILILTPADEHTVKMRQVAIAPALQGQGLGAKLVQASEMLARSQNFRRMVLHARETAVPFYLKLGYQIVGEPFEEVTIPHAKMEKAL
ncbi:MAG TPA: GNAT family N-acetyltransferase [Saprospiraceae bacterium]|nr:GNAT family N-acetyltransferase [Saprospiraceae bacterium]